MPLVRNAVTFSFCHVARSSRTTIAILVSNMAPCSPLGSRLAEAAETVPDGARVTLQRRLDFGVELIHRRVEWPLEITTPRYQEQAMNAPVAPVSPSLEQTRALQSIDHARDRGAVDHQSGTDCRAALAV